MPPGMVGLARFEAECHDCFNRLTGGEIRRARRALPDRDEPTSRRCITDLFIYVLAGLEMRLPVIQGVIRRRILVNYRIAPDTLQAQLPPRFRPKLHKGLGVAGICLIRLEAIRPRHVPALLGVSSENAAHRVAVVWGTDDGEGREGVFVPRRDTGSLLNHLTGGRLFPGEHNRAHFRVQENPTGLDLSMESNDGKVAVRVRGSFGGDLQAGSCFASLAEASSFFGQAPLGTL